MRYYDTLVFTCLSTVLATLITGGQVIRPLVALPLRTRQTAPSVSICVDVASSQIAALFGQEIVARIVNAIPEVEDCTSELVVGSNNVFNWVYNCQFSDNVRNSNTQLESFDALVTCANEALAGAEVPVSCQSVLVDLGAIALGAISEELAFGVLIFEVWNCMAQ